MKYIPDIEFEADEQRLNEFYNALYLDAERYKKGFYSLADLEQMLSQKGYPQIKGAKEILEKFIHIKQIILCSGFEHRGSAF